MNNHDKKTFRKRVFQVFEVCPFRMAKRRSGICKCYVEIPDTPKQKVLLNAVASFFGE